MSPGLFQTRSVLETEPATPPRASNTRLRDLIDRNLDFLWRSLRRLGVCEADLGDAVQQVFWIATCKLAQIEEGKERAFLFQSALRVSANTRRARRRRKEVVEEGWVDQADSSPRPDDWAEARRRRALLDELLDRLPLELRAVFVLSEIEEITMAEIATMLGIPPGTVASRLRRARAQFEDHVQKLHERERQREP